MGYSSKRNVQILIALLKEHDISKVIVSPGTTNIMFVASIQNDEWFDIYSAADERSAAYMACGMSMESGEVVVLTCTGATASRNYLPGLTEAYYKQLPILVVTSLLNSAVTDNLMPQVIDRSITPKDTVRFAVNIPEVKLKSDEWKTNFLINKAILELSHGKGGPVHINLLNDFSYDFSLNSIPRERVISRCKDLYTIAQISNNSKTAVFIGSHSQFDKSTTEEIEKFCRSNNAIVLCDQTSNYQGLYRINGSLVLSQEQISNSEKIFDLIIDIGGITGDYYQPIAKSVWRIDKEGDVKDRFHSLSIVFEMDENTFFKEYNDRYANACTPNNTSLYEHWIDLYNSIYSRIPELPYSNIWIAKCLAKKIPQNSRVHLGILNTLRAWDFFVIDNSIICNSNVGGFGIDGDMSTIIGAAIVHPEKLFFLFIGDLAFFYDINSLGNRHVGKNLRILLVNNGCGTEFKNYSHPGSMFGADTDLYIAAGGHYGNKSSDLVKHYTIDLGFKYLAATTKDDFLKNCECFTDAKMDKSIIYEVFTDSQNESEALKIVRNIVHNTDVKRIVRDALGQKNIEKLKMIIRK